jgi:hypothetical protein
MTMRDFMRACVIATLVTGAIAAAEKNVVREGASQGAPVTDPAKHPTLKPGKDGGCPKDYVKLDDPALCVLGAKLWKQADQEALAAVYYEVLKRKKDVSSVFGADPDEKQQPAYAQAQQHFVEEQRAGTMSLSPK